MGLRRYTREEAQVERLEFDSDGLIFFGWLWRAPSKNVHQWHFTSSMNPPSRSYPADAEFIPVITIRGDE